MKFHLLEIVLWPRNPVFPPRRLRFEAGRTNVITGGSKTGKSAVIPIIDYCLGSDRCAVPVSTIRDSCSWFGIIVETDEGQKLIARREPGDQQSTGDMYLQEGASIEVPGSAPEKNTTVDGVKRTLDRLSGLTNLGFDPTGLAGGYKLRPSFRDMAAFMFQPQNLVANPDVLFYKADTTEHREKLRTIFPYILGAITPELLAKRWEMDQVQRELRRIEHELSAKTQATERWKAEIHAWISEARELGLISPEKTLEGRTEGELINLLSRVVSGTSVEAEVTVTTIEVSSREAGELDREESIVSMQLSEVRTRMEKMIKLRETVNEYTGALQKQRERLGLSRWLREQAHDTSCPICGGDFADSQHELDQLCDALAEVEATARQMSPAPSAFARELVQVREDARRHTDQLQAIRLRRRRLEERSKEAKENAWRRSSIDRYLGRAQQALTMFASPVLGDGLRENAEKLRARLESLRGELSEGSVRDRIRAALSHISAYMSRVLPSLDSERPNDPAELNIDDLTIRVTGLTGRSDYLWEIGSGANWLSYHVACTLALHAQFLGQSASPVPGMLVYDQPSQVYFPQTLARTPAVGEDPQLRDEDVAAVRKVFEVFGTSVRAAKKGLQVIVLDHAGQEVWGDIEEVHMVEEWRNGRALVPQAWLT